MSIIEGAFPENFRASEGAQVFRCAAEDGALQDAIDGCEANRGDMIIVEPGSHSVTEMVEFNKAGIIVMGAEYGANPTAVGEKYTVNAASSLSSGPVATITQPCKIVGLGFAGRDTTAESLLFDCEETGGFNAGFTYLLNCRFSCWYGAMTYLVRCIGGQLNRFEGCTFDGLFGGVGTAAIYLETDTGVHDPGFMQIVGNWFYGIGSGIPAVQMKSGSTGTGIAITDNYLVGGFTDAAGVLCDLNSTDSWGIITRNHCPTLADKTAAVLNAGSWTGGIGGNYYAES